MRPVLRAALHSIVAAPSGPLSPFLAAGVTCYGRLHTPSTRLVMQVLQQGGAAVAPRSPREMLGPFPTPEDFGYRRGQHDLAENRQHLHAR